MSIFDLARPVSAFAPMQDISSLSFMNILAQYGAPDIFFAEYFRVHEFSKPDVYTLRTVRAKPAGKQVVAQFIGENIFDIKRSIEQIKKYPEIRCLDLNLGCPAPKVYKKNVGGGLLKDPAKIREIILAMREAWDGTLSVKMRLGFENKDHFFEILEIVNSSGADFLTLHARTVKQLYRGEVDYQSIGQAVKFSKIPVIANGDLTSASKALEIAETTKAAGVMIGRSAVRNPWIFRQINELKNNKSMFEPTLEDVFDYTIRIYESILEDHESIKNIDSRMKKFLNFIGVSVDSEGLFLNEMRHTRNMDELMRVCEKHLLGNRFKPYADEPYPKLCSRPNHED